MRSIRFSAFCLAALALPLAAKADSTLFFQGTLADNMSVNGSYTYDANGNVTGGSVDINGESFSSLHVSDGYYTDANTYDNADLEFNNAGDEFILYTPFPGTLADFNLSPSYFCSASSVPCAGDFLGGSFPENSYLDSNAGISILQTVSLWAAPFSTTPEPSSLMLLGTGLLGVGSTLRRRLIAR